MTFMGMKKDKIFQDQAWIYVKNIHLKQVCVFENAIFGS